MALHVGEYAQYVYRRPLDPFDVARSKEAIDAYGVWLRVKTPTIAFLALILSAGCGNDSEVAPIAPGTPQAPAQVEPESEVATPEGPRPEGEQTLEGGLSIEVLDMQLFHPNTPHRELMDPRDLTRRTSERGNGFGLGVLLSVQNDSEYVLGAPRIISNLAVRGAHGEATCRLVQRSRSYWGRTRNPMTILSPQVSERTPWADETRNSTESLWRPGETLRIRGVLECGPVQVLDIEPQGLSGHFTLAARAPFVPHEVVCDRDQEICDDDIVGSIDALDVPARAFGLQAATLPTGESGYAAGDIFIHAVDGRPKRETFSDLETSLFESETADLPASPVLTPVTIGEWSMNLTGVTMSHWTDAEGVDKGKRLVSVTATLAIDAANIGAQLALTLRAAETELAAAESALRVARLAIEQSEPGSQAMATLMSTEREVQARVRSSSSAASRAQSTYQRTLGSARSSLVRLLSCDRVQLVSTKGTQRADNARDAGVTCRTLSDADSVTVVWTFSVDRYETPVGITYQLGRDHHTTFFAAQSLSTFDVR
ncbi:MAG: hypothetical protein ACI9KE_001836 [Polyangiales bacterium]